MNFTTKEKQAIIAILSSIMKADGVVQPDEQQFIDRAYRKLGISIHDLQGSATMGADECKQVYNALSEEKKNHVSKCFLDMVGVDGKVDLRELKVLHGLL